MLNILRWRGIAFLQTHPWRKTCLLSLLVLACIATAVIAQESPEDEIDEAMGDADTSIQQIAKFHSATPPQISREDYCNAMRDAEQHLQNLLSIKNNFSSSDYNDNIGPDDVAQAADALYQELQTEWARNGDRICDPPPRIDLGGEVTKPIKPKTAEPPEGNDKQRKTEKQPQPDGPKTGHVEQIVPGKDEKLPKASREKKEQKAAKHLMGPKTAAGSKTDKAARIGPKENKAGVQIEVFSTRGGGLGGTSFGH
jgi:hypothetical protein